MPKVIFSPTAWRDLTKIGLHIGEDSPGAADALLDRIDEKCRWLATQPEAGEIVLDAASGKYRRFTVGSYVLYYCRVPEGVWIARVLHGAQNHMGLL